jgi:hypothetical protein
MPHRIPWPLALAAGAVCCCVLSFYQATDAAPPAENLPFANAVQQRMDMIAELKAIHALLQEQNTLVREQNELLRSLGAGATSKAPTQPARR